MDDLIVAAFLSQHFGGCTLYESLMAHKQWIVLFASCRLNAVNKRTKGGLYINIHIVYKDTV